MESKLDIGFLGAGKMATALAGGFVRAGLCTPGNIIASDPVEMCHIDDYETNDDSEYIIELQFMIK
jgi:pyrroline-5-carboxylate reductase